MSARCPDLASRADPAISPQLADTRSPHDHGLPPDLSMRGFSTALDAGAMAAQISEHVLDGQTVSACRVVRFRHRPGDRLIVVYEAEFADPEHGSRRQILTGRIHAGTSAKVAKTKPAHRTTACIPDLDMRIEVFPHDRRLPALVEFAESPGARAMALIQQGYEGLHRATGDIEITTVRYRPGISATLRYQFGDAAASTAPRTCFIKVTSHPDIAAEATAAQRVNAALGRTGAQLRLSVPRTVDQSSGAALFHTAAGRTLQSLAETGDSPQLAAACAGAHLAVLHTTVASGLPVSIGADVTEKIDGAARIVSWACPELAQRVEAAADSARKVTAAEIRAPVHLDMKLDHIFLAESGRAELIDTGSVSAGNPLIDIGCLIARINFLVATGAVQQNRANAITSSLCAAYFDRVPVAWRHALEPAVAYGALLVSTHAIQGLLPRWRSIVRSGIDAAIDPWGWTP